MIGKGERKRYTQLNADFQIIASIYIYSFIDCAKAFDCVDHSKLWKTLKEMGIPDDFTCFLRNLYVGKEATVRSEHGTMD